MGNSTNYKSKAMDKEQNECRDNKLVDQNRNAVKVGLTEITDLVLDLRSQLADKEKEVERLKELLDKADSYLMTSYDSFQSQEDLHHEIKALLSPEPKQPASHQGTER